MKRWLSYTKRFVEGLTYTNQTTGESHPVVEEVRAWGDTIRVEVVARPACAARQQPCIYHPLPPQTVTADAVLDAVRASQHRLTARFPCNNLRIDGC